MTRFHFTQHGTRRGGDALDLFDEEVMLLDRLFSAWAHSVPGNAEQPNAVEAKWDHGTVGKLLLEHGAVRVAAERDIVRVLREVGVSELTDHLDDEIHSISPIVVRMYDTGRGVQPISLAITPEFVDAVEELRQTLQNGIMEAQPIETLSRCLTPWGGAAATCTVPNTFADTHPLDRNSNGGSSSIQRSSGYRLRWIVSPDSLGPRAPWAIGSWPPALTVKRLNDDVPLSDTVTCSRR